MRNLLILTVLFCSYDAHTESSINYSIGVSIEHIIEGGAKVKIKSEKQLTYNINLSEFRDCIFEKAILETKSDKFPDKILMPVEGWLSFSIEPETKESTFITLYCESGKYVVYTIWL